MASLGSLSDGLNLLLIELGSLFSEDVQKSLGRFQDLIECTLRFLDGLVVLIPGDVLLGKRSVDNLKSVGECSHLFLDLSLFFLFLIDEGLYLILLSIDGVHHFDEIIIGVV